MSDHHSHPAAPPNGDESEPCDLLDWDSRFFGHGVARVRGDTLTPDRAADIDAWSRRTGASLLYFLARADDPPTIRAAEAAGYRLTDVRMTFERQATTEDREPLTRAVRPYEEDDLRALRALARVSYRDSRFYQDDRIPREKADGLFELWTENACRGSPSHVRVAEVAGRVAGYATIDARADERLARIGLIAIDESFRGRGLGRALVESALTCAASWKLDRVEVVTQGRNVAAQRLYQRCGFLTRGVQLQYHKWYD